jgi:hypothetical protein
VSWPTADPSPGSLTRSRRSSRLPSGRASSGEPLQPPSEAELPVLRLLAGDLSVREIGERLFLSQTRSGHTPARSTTSSQYTPAPTRSPAPPPSDC